MQPFLAKKLVTKDRPTDIVRYRATIVAKNNSMHEEYLISLYFYVNFIHIYSLIIKI